MSSVNLALTIALYRVILAPCVEQIYEAAGFQYFGLNLFQSPSELYHYIWYKWLCLSYISYTGQDFSLLFPFAPQIDNMLGKCKRCF